MANIMSQKDVKNNVHRSGFDLSTRRLFTSKTGEIVPVKWFECLPGDKFTINMSEFMRTVPFVTANFGRLRHYVDAYFVPYRLLWDKFPDWIVQTDNQHYAQSVTQGASKFSSQPYITSQDLIDYIQSLLNIDFDIVDSTPVPATYAYQFDDAGMKRWQTTTKLLQYLGYGFKPEFKNDTSPGTSAPYKKVYTGFPNYAYLNPPVNLFPLAAYQKICQDFFRFSQWRKAAPWTYNFDYVLNDNNLHLDLPSTLYQTSNLFDMHYCNYDKDLFNGILPQAQYGSEAIASPIIGSLHGSLEMAFPYDSGSNGMYSPFIVDKNGRYTLVQARYGDGVDDINTSNSATLRVNQQDPAAVAGLSVLGIRFGEMLQKWKEITISGSPEFKEQLMKHWGVLVPDYASDRCRYLGGMSNIIDIAEVTNQNLTAGNEADVAGKGSASQNCHIKFSVPDGEYGIIMIMSHVKPVIEWNATQVFHPSIFRHEVTDYPIPEFDNLGNQAVNSLMFDQFSARTDSNGNIISDSVSVPSMGFAPRYFDYKTNYDEVCGGFLDMPQWTLIHNVPLNVLRNGDTWISSFKNFLNKLLPNKVITANSPLWSFFMVNPSVTDSLFDREADGSYESDVYYHSVYLDVKVARNLSYDGLPY